MQNPFARAVLRRDDLPVLPGAFPLLGHLPVVFKDLPAVLRRARAELGPLFWITTGMDTWILVATGPEALEIFKSKAFTSAHLQKIAPLVAGESVLAHDGSAHRHMRGALNKPFTPRGLSASTIGPMMARVLADLTARWAARGEARVLPEIQETALEVIFRMLGVDVGELAEWRVQYRALLLANLNIKIDLPGSPARRAAHAKKWIDARFLGLVAAARKNPDAETLLGVLAGAEDDDGKRLGDVELVDNLRLLVLGGHETISSTMAWMAITLAAHRGLWDELADEVKGASGVPATPAEARAFPFAEALFRETVRVHPPFGTITRMAVEDTTSHGKRIPAGTIVAVDLWGIAHDEALFPEPDAFKPSRWLGRTGAPSAVELSQFGAGAHFCLGYHLAWLEAVQFAVALGQSLARAGLRPALVGDAPRPIYLPTEHPPAKTKIRFVR